MDNRGGDCDPDARLACPPQHPPARSWLSSAYAQLGLHILALQPSSPTLRPPHLLVQPTGARARALRESSWPGLRLCEPGWASRRASTAQLCSASGSLTTEFPPSCHAFPSALAPSPSCTRDRAAPGRAEEGSWETWVPKLQPCRDRPSPLVTQRDYREVVYLPLSLHPCSDKDLRQTAPSRSLR